MAARSIALGWEIPAYGTDADVWQNENITLTFTRSTAVTISGWTITGYLRKFHGDSSAALTLTGTITDAPNGVFTLTLTAAQTAALVNQSHQLEVWRLDAGSATMISIVTINVLEGRQA